MLNQKGAVLKKVLLALIVFIIVCIVVFVMAYKNMVKTVESTKLSNFDLTNIEDGVYEGSFSKFLVYAKVKVTVEEHKITNIEVVEQRAGKGYEAHEILDRVIQAQSLEVDVVTGATGSSKCLLIAIDKALSVKEWILNHSK